MNDVAEIKEGCGCSSTAVYESALHSGGSCVDRRGCHSGGCLSRHLLCLKSCRLRRHIELGRCQASPWEKRTVARRGATVKRLHRRKLGAYLGRVCVSAAQICVGPLGMGTCAFFDRAVTNSRSASVCVATLEIPSRKGGVRM
jgi:hypothetical protein